MSADDRSEKRSRSRSRSRSKSIDYNDSELKEEDNAKKQKLSSRKLLITNISYEVKWQELKDLMRDEVGEVAFVQIFESPDGRSKGTGIIEFKTEDLAEKCLEKMHRFEFKGRELVVKEDKEPERDKYGNPVKRSENGVDFETYGIEPSLLKQLNISGPLTNRLFIANIDYKADDKKMREIFSLAGKVNRVWLHKDDDGKPRGTGIIEMSHPIEAVQAISMLNGQKLFNRDLAIRIDKFTQDEDLKSQKFPVPKPIVLPRGLKAVGMGIGIGGAPLSMSQLFNEGEQSSSMGNNMQMMSLMNNLFNSNSMGMGNSMMQNNLVNSLFSSMMGGMYGNNASMFGAGMMDGMGSTNGSMTGLTNPLGGSTSSMMNGYGSILGQTPSNAYGMGMGMDTKIGNIGNETNKVIVKNLPPAYKWQDLKDRFREAGEIKYASVSHKDDSSDGHIQFASPEGAKRAIRMLNKTRLGGRPVNVQLDY